MVLPTKEIVPSEIRMGIASSQPGLAMQPRIKALTLLWAAQANMRALPEVDPGIVLGQVQLKMTTPSTAARA